MCGRKAKSEQRNRTHVSNKEILALPKPKLSYECQCSGRLEEPSLLLSEGK